jgi:hypothetical protein
MPAKLPAARAATCCGGHDVNASRCRAAHRIRFGCHAQPLTEVLRCNLLTLPVHAGGLPVIDLHAVHAHISFAMARVAGDHQRQCDEAAAVHGPALQHGKVEQAEIVAEDDLFALGLPCRHDFGEVLPYLGQHGQHLQLAQHAFG